MKKYLSVLMLATSLNAFPIVANAAPQEATASVASEVSASDVKKPVETAKPHADVIAPPKIVAKAYLVQDFQSQQILTGSDLDTQIEPASLTKLMTAYLVFKALEEGRLSESQQLTPSDKAWRAEGSRTFLSQNKPVVVADLIKGMIVQSGNDAAITLAEALGGGSEKGFVDLMNAEAKRLGMTNTQFMNSTGLPSDEHYSTVRDLAILSNAIIRDFPKYYPIYSMKAFKYNNIEQPNRNLLLFRDESVDGLKTGHTSSAGYNLIASSKRNQRRVLSIVVGTDSVEARAAESSKLLNWAHESFDTQKVYDANETITEVKVYKGSERSVNVGFLEPIYVTIPRGMGKDVKLSTETIQPVLAPVQKGQVLGKLKITYKDQILLEQNVVALDNVEEAGWFRRFIDSIILWFKNMFSGE